MGGPGKGDGCFNQRHGEDSASGEAVVWQTMSP